MICPFCKNPGDGDEEPIINLGGKKNYDTVDHRRYFCTICRRIWRTSETFDIEIFPRDIDQIELSRDVQRRIGIG